MLQGMDEDYRYFGLIDEEHIALDAAALSSAVLDHPSTDLAAYHDLLDSM